VKRRGDAPPTGWKAFDELQAELQATRKAEGWPDGFADLWGRLYERGEDGEPRLRAEATYHGDDLAELDKLFGWAARASATLPEHRKASRTLRQASEAAAAKAGDAGLINAGRIAAGRPARKGKQGVDWEAAVWEYATLARGHDDPEKAKLAAQEAVTALAARLGVKPATVCDRLEEVRADWRKLFADFERQVEDGEPLTGSYAESWRRHPVGDVVNEVRAALAALDRLPHHTLYSTRNE
jgi:hypothetical protein